MHDLYFYSTDLIFFFLRLDLAWSYMHDAIQPACITWDQRARRGGSQGGRRVIFYITCAPPVEFCEVDPMQTESLACTIVESSPPDPCICAQQMVCRLSMRSLNRSGCARARADDSGIQGARGGARVTCILALLGVRRYLHSGVMHACICARMRAL